MPDLSREEIRREARQVRLRHNDQFYGPMKDAVCACDVCLWAGRWLDSQAVLDAAEQRAEEAEAMLREGFWAHYTPMEERALLAEARLARQHELVGIWTERAEKAEADCELQRLRILDLAERVEESEAEAKRLRGGARRFKRSSPDPTDRPAE